ncbi:hypothetical protein AGMMS50229_14470 [Campylobacterota bacterium]|nr:hypothetical protein AGMMS50229_14470 [Campylobacterota bacterium]
MKKADDKRCKILPVDVGLLKNLQYLDISGMCLDEIPFDALASLPQLQELRIYGNSEAITLPGDIGSLRQSIKQGVYLA